MRLRRPNGSQDVDGEAQALRAALRTSHATYRSLLDSLPEAFVQIDEHGVILDWNLTAERTFGWPRYEAIGRSLVGTVVPESDGDSFRGMIRHFIDSGVGQPAGQRVARAAMRKGGEEIVVELTVGAQQLPEGWIFNAFAHDIVERQRRASYVEARPRPAVVSAESRPPDESWGPLLRALGEPLGWSGGAVFLVDDADEAMTCVEFWAVEGLDASVLELQS